MEEETKTYRVEGEFTISGTANMDICAESESDADELFRDFFEYACIDYPKGSGYNYNGDTDVDVDYGTEQVWVNSITEVPHQKTEVERLREKVAELEDKLNEEKLNSDIAGKQ